jgi:glycerophosphoryl diester phosphodiesterase
MKTIITGGRDVINPELLEKAIMQSRFAITEVVCGGARGADDLGQKWAGNGNLIPVKLFPPEWNRYGKAAGMVRNKEMAEYADALIALWDGASKGTKNMIGLASKRGLKVYVFRVDKENEEQSGFHLL